MALRNRLANCLVVACVVGLASIATAQTSTPAATATPANTSTVTATVTPVKTAKRRQAVELANGGVGLVGNLVTTSGGTMVQVLRQPIGWADTTDTTLFQLPANAVPLNIYVDVPTAFNDTGTDLLNVGITGTTAYFISGLDVSSTGRKAPTLLKMGESVGTSAVSVTAKYTGQNSDSSAGQAIIEVLYMVP